MSLTLNTQKKAKEIASRLYNENQITREEYGFLLKSMEFYTLDDQNEALEELWSDFGDVPMDPDTEKIEADFMHFPHGTDRETIWHWFDERYSAGVTSLLYGYDGVDRTAELAQLCAMKQLCVPCDQSTCVYNHNGECRYALVHAKAPELNREISVCKSNAPLRAFIVEEVPFRLKTMFEIDEDDITDELIDEIVNELSENSDDMFDYDSLDNMIAGILKKHGIECC